MESQLRSFISEPTLSSAIERAGRAETPEGRRYHHQCRLSPAVLKLAAKHLRNAPLRKAKSFNELHQIVEQAIGSIRGIGVLMVYDTALRIGAKLDFLPLSVYVHRGTKIGARALGLNWRASIIEVRDIPRELHVLKPHEIEDCLCIFKNRFRRQQAI
jgi:hypothetical protein